MSKLSTPPKRPQRTQAEVVISVDDAHLENISGVVKQLRGLGLKVADVIESIGTVTGSIPAGELNRLSAVPGVAHVERQRTFQLPPPDAPVQ